MGFKLVVLWTDWVIFAILVVIALYARRVLRHANLRGVWTKVEDEAGKVRFDLTTPDWSAIVFGAKLTRPAPVGDVPAEALPTDKKDPRIVDLDGDGKLGVTMKAALGR